MGMIATPSAEDQLDFLTKIQRLFNESDFSSTYKYALLISLADLAIEHGKDDSSRLEISNKTIAERFIELYWQQSSPYKTSKANESGVLFQNNGVQASIVKSIDAFRQGNRFNSPSSAKGSKEYERLVATVAATVAKQPINYLQNVGGETLPFLYERNSSSITLKNGVSYCLRRFQPLIQQLARSRWADFIKRNTNNTPILGEKDDLNSFLFETSRQTLALVCRGLKEAYGNKCFYCNKASPKLDVDHFIPFSLYPRDLMHNFVLACPNCNRSKSDALAAKIYLDRWVNLLSKHSNEILNIGEKAGIQANQETSLAIAKWAYGACSRGEISTWIKPNQYEKLKGETCVHTFTFPR
ncbi:HNH endonuclease [Polynucleobacter sp. AP-Ainpum-60-G11]|nr:HNH endonuclease [Polynucleobacter sp. AP-Ainpum-60-G11]